MKVVLVVLSFMMSSLSAHAYQHASMGGGSGENQNISTCCPICKDLQSQYCRANEAAMKAAKEVSTPNSAPKGSTVPSATGVTI